MKPMIFTLVGKDKPGLIDSLAKTVYALKGNWTGSNFSHMAGHLAGFVHVDVPEEHHQALLDAFEAHPDLRIHLVPGEANTPENEKVVLVDVMGNDKTGIVQELTSVLHQFNINIIKFDSSCEPAPNWGGTLFKAQAKVAVPRGFDLDALTDALEDIANDLVVDIEIRR
ncbi:glycine cleavage system protein R [Aestuariibacter sp. AA17]|uniref:Glycine cleavage system transcriptional repressor n=1 Tax=Fluctibacter corallii TaxID=2984329 RepID=A0ABT3A8K3_9ALTE|nr:ACT domain-containing protein [Aestuariibacter sp. AA17]MCV2884938.1 glycine cleavage system protein R [Aestuariibacter sp. AA17]